MISIQRDTPLPIDIYSTLTRSKAPFETIEPGRVSMYVCGNTVYDNAHIGHAMSSIVFDVIRRYLEFAGYRVTLAKNYTDVDDKIIARANADGLDPAALVESLIAADVAESAALNVIEPSLRPRATEEIPCIVHMVEGLIANGHAYERNGDVYFRVRSFAAYGRLSQRNVDDLRSGYRIGVDEDKEDPLDFALWKSAKPGEPSWPSPWGHGRPGWHIECSAMCSRHLGEHVDIHGGGTDLVFPHHENEIAQSEAYFGTGPFARYWLHNGMLTIDGQKMSKSIGNVVSIQALIDRNRTAAFRLMILQSHYRVPFTYGDIILQAAQNALDRLRAAANTAAASDGDAPPVIELDDLTPSVERRFIAAMSDDFDTPVATAAIFELARAINRIGASHPGSKSLLAAGEMLRHLTAILGLDLDAPVQQTTSDIGTFVDLLIDIRHDLRAAKQFALADKIRNELTARGVTLEDSPTGTTWKQSIG